MFNIFGACLLFSLAAYSSQVSPAHGVGQALGYLALPIVVAMIFFKGDDRRNAFISVLIIALGFYSYQATNKYRDTVGLAVAKTSAISTIDRILNRMEGKNVQEAQVLQLEPINKMKYWTKVIAGHLDQILWITEKFEKDLRLLNLESFFTPPNLYSAVHLKNALVAIENYKSLLSSYEFEINLIGDKTKELLFAQANSVELRLMLEGWSKTSVITKEYFSIEWRGIEKLKDLVSLLMPLTENSLIYIDGNGNVVMEDARTRERYSELVNELMLLGKKQEELKQATDLSLIYLKNILKE